DTIHQVSLGEAGAKPASLRAKLPAIRNGRWELAGLELDEPAGLQATNGHQNGENIAAGTQAAGTVRLGAVSFLDAGGLVISHVTAAGWRGVGAASASRDAGGDEVSVRFTDSG